MGHARHYDAMNIAVSSVATQVALRAFQDMGQSKTQYFGLLQRLDTKYKYGGSPSTDESLQLEKLLKEHDRNVMAFNVAMANVDNLDDRLQLIKLMS